MAVEYVGRGDGGASQGGAALPTMPVGAAANDVLLLVIEAWGSDANVDPAPTGGAWTLVGSVASDPTGASSASTRCTVYWAPYDAGINLTVPDGGNHTIARVWAFRGADTTNPFDGSPTTGSDAVSSIDHSAVTGQSSVTLNAMAVLAFTHGDNLSSPASGGPTNANLTSLTNAGSFDSTLGNDGTLCLLYGTRATAGAIGTWSWGAVSAVEHDAWVSMVLGGDKIGGGFMLMGVG